MGLIFIPSHWLMYNKMYLTLQALRVDLNYHIVIFWASYMRRRHVCSIAEHVPVTVFTTRADMLHLRETDWTNSVVLSWICVSTFQLVHCDHGL